MQKARGDSGESFDLLERDAQGDEAEAGACPGEEGAFAGEKVAGEAAGVFEGLGAERRDEAAEHCWGGW